MMRERAAPLEVHPMDEMADRLHSALVETFGLIAERMPDAWMRCHEGYVVVSVPTFPFHLANAVWAAGPGEGPAVRALGPAIAEIEGRGADPGVVLIGERTPGVEEAARDLGFAWHEDLPGMVVDAASLRIPAEPACELVLVGSDPDLLEAAQGVTARGFEAPREPFDAYFATAVGSEPVDLWLAYVDGEPVSTATGVLLEDALGVFNVATPPEHRRKGYGAWLTAHAIRRGFEAGASFAYLQSSEMGFRVYEGLGFEQVSTYRLFVRG